MSTQAHTSERLDDSPEEVAIGIMKKHREFLHREQLLAETYSKGLSELPRTVSSRRQVKDCSTSGERKAPQTQKNRKRKMKKKRAKDKHFKLSSDVESTTSKDED